MGGETLLQFDPRLLPVRSIPAWAGKPSWRCGSGAACGVHPRVGGETRRQMRALSDGCGPSPRGRGNQIREAVPEGVEGSIPAWAGKPVPLVFGAWCQQVHPRVGGETHSVCRIHCSHAGPSPRGRGNRPVASVRLIRGGSHPRVGGETGRTRSTPRRRRGPSPRGRGNHWGAGTALPANGSIPAWAGKPPRIDRSLPG